MHVPRPARDGARSRAAGRYGRPAAHQAGRNPWRCRRRRGRIRPGPAGTCGHLSFTTASPQPPRASRTSGARTLARRSWEGARGPQPTCCTSRASCKISGTTPARPTPTTPTSPGGICPGCSCPGTATPLGGRAHTRGEDSSVNIIECHFEFGGFDDQLVRGGISVYMWNLCRQFSPSGHAVTGLTAGHGLLPERGAATTWKISTGATRPRFQCGLTPSLVRLPGAGGHTRNGDGPPAAGGWH